MLFSKLRSWIWVISLLLFSSSCTTMCSKSHKEMTAEEVVESYLTNTFNLKSVSGIDDLIKFTSGNLKQALTEAEPSTIDRIFIQKKYKVEQFSFLERKDITPREVEISYQLKYQELNQPDNAVVSIKNTLNLIRKEGAWYITDVIGGETSIDFLITDQITSTQQ